MVSGYLQAATDAELRAELRQREEAAKHPPRAAGKCDRCGAEWFFQGSFSAPRFERQHAAFADQHKDCPLSADGGGI